MEQVIGPKVGEETVAKDYSKTEEKYKSLGSFIFLLRDTKTCTKHFFYLMFPTLSSLHHCEEKEFSGGLFYL